MKITRSRYKNVFALRLETEKYIALVLPSEGGKIASFQDKTSGKEYLLQNPSLEYLRIGLTDDFEKGECSGFDDMFPTIDPVVVNGFEYPDHGEVCRVCFDYCVDKGVLTLLYRSLTLSYEYVKIFSERSDGALNILYTIKNFSDADLNALWAAHCMIKAEKGGQVFLPFENGELVDLIEDGNIKRTSNARMPYRREILFSDWEDGCADCKKLYFPKACKEGYIAYRYPSGDAFTLEFDRKELPYIGIWQNFGEVNGSYCLALEPCSVGYDTVVNAEKYGQKRVIKAGESMQFNVAMSIRSSL